MKLIFSALLTLLYLSAPGSVIRIANGQGQKTNVRILGGGDDGQCPSTEEKDRARNEIHQIISSVIATTAPTTTELSTTTSAATTTSATTTPTMTTMSTTAGICECYSCNGTPGWRRVAFIDMTDTSYDRPTGLSLTSLSKRT